MKGIYETLFINLGVVSLTELAYKQKHTPLRTIVLPVVTDQAAASLNPAKGQAKVLVEACKFVKSI